MGKLFDFRHLSLLRCLNYLEICLILPFWLWGCFDYFCLTGIWRLSKANVILARSAEDRELFKSTPELTFPPPKKQTKKKIRERALMKYKASIHHISRETMIIEWMISYYLALSQRGTNSGGIFCEFFIT